MLAGLWHVRTPHRPNTTRAAADQRAAHGPQTRCARAGRCQVSVVKPSSLAGYSLRGSGTAGTHCPTGFHPEWGRAALAIHGHAANHALGTEHAFRLPESLFSVTVAARFGQLSPGFAAGLAPARTGARPFFLGIPVTRPGAERMPVACRPRVELMAPDDRLPVSTRTPESGHGRSTQKVDHAIANTMANRRAGARHATCCAAAGARRKRAG
jgi:hypothetical protein